jgi:hypothetical protein
MDANIQQQAKRKAPGKPSVKPKVRGAMGLELRAAIAKAKAEAMRELEGIDYTQALPAPALASLLPEYIRRCCLLQAARSWTGAPFLYVYSLFVFC